MMQVKFQTWSQQLISMYATQDNGGRVGDFVINDAYLALFTDDSYERKGFINKSSNDANLSSKYTNQFGNIPPIRLA